MMINNDHIITLHFRNIQFYMIEILFACIILKSIGDFIEESSNFFECFKLIQLFIIFALKFGFLFYILKNFLLLKIRNINCFKGLLKKSDILKHLIQGKLNFVNHNFSNTSKGNFLTESFKIMLRISLIYIHKIMQKENK